MLLCDSLTDVIIMVAIFAELSPAWRYRYHIRDRARQEHIQSINITLLAATYLSVD